MESSSTKSHYKTYHEIINKTLHDAAFDFTYNYIKPKDIDLCKNCHHEYNEYVKLNRVFNFVDFAYLEKIVSKGGLIEYLKKMQRRNISETTWYKFNFIIHIKYFAMSFFNTLKNLRYTFPNSQMTIGLERSCDVV